MKRLLPIVLLALACAAAATQSGEPAAKGGPGSPSVLRSSPASLSWMQLQGEIAKTICVLSSPVNGREHLAPVAGFRKQCGQPDADTPAARAVDRAFEQAGMLIGSLKPPGLDEALKPGLSPEERNRIARHAWLSSEPFLRALLPRLRTALDANGVSCLDCPAPPQRERRTVTWEQIRPYIAAHVWPDPVRTRPTDPPGRAEYSFHICTGLNGISLMKDPDPELVRAGFLGVMGSRETQERAGIHFEEILNEEAFRKLSEDEERTRYLRQRLPEEIGKDEVVRASVCKKLASLEEDLGLIITDCATMAPAEQRGRS